MPSERDGQGSGGAVRAPSAQAVREQLARILASAEFVASDRLREFLRFVVEETLAGRADQLKAYTIALAVFGRDGSFDPQTDPVVRMEAGKLRRRLETYHLGAGRNDPVRIAIPKGGYVASFRQSPDVEAVASKPVARSRGLRGALLGVAGLGAAALLVATLAPWRAETPTIEAEVGPPAPQERGPAIIVLPFENLSEDPDRDDAFAAGLTEELISNLMRFGELRLYSAHGSFLEQPSAEPDELSQRLDLGYVIKGSVRRGPDWVRLIVHLIEADTGRHLWSETYDRALSAEAVFAVQEQLAADLASQLAQPYGIVQQVTADTFRRGRPQTLFAYECVLRAFAYRRTHERALYRPTRHCLEEAVRRDPGYADAWALLAYVYLDEYRLGYGRRSGDRSISDLALTTARHATELDPDSVLGLLALSVVHFYRREFAEADAVHRRLLSLNPTNPEVLAQVGWRKAFLGDWDQGMALVQQAITRSIEAPSWYHWHIALHNYRKGDYHAARAELQQIAEAKWVWVPLLCAATHGQLGDQEGARHDLELAMALDAVTVKDPRSALRLHNVPEDVIDKLMDGLIKAGQRTYAATL